MAHGSPRKEICDKCNIYGLTPRFSMSECPNCGERTRSISNDELREKLGLSILDSIPMYFDWKKVINKR
jgi:hypothetical protein